MTALVARLLDVKSVPPPILMLTVVLSYGGLILAAAVGWPLWALVGAASLPWLVVFGLEVQWTYRHFKWLGLMYLLVLTQGGHFVEHLVQMVQIHVYGASGKDAHGIFGQLDVEWVHFGFNTWILVAVIALLVHYRTNRWLWLTLLVAGWHQVEHVYIMAQYLGEFGRAGHPGLLSSGGAVAGGLAVTRPDLHFLYNVIETAPMFVAFGVALKESHDEWIAKAFPHAPASLLTEATQKAENLVYESGRAIVEQGDAADAFFIVVSGEVEVARQREVDGPEEPVAMLGPGQFFGEMGLLTASPRMATVRAASRVEVLRLDRETFRTVIAESEETAIDLTEVAARRSQRTQAPSGA